MKKGAPIPPIQKITKHLPSHNSTQSQFQIHCTDEFEDHPNNTFEDECLTAVLPSLEEDILAQDKDEEIATKALKRQVFPCVKTALPPTAVSTSSATLCEEIGKVLADLKMYKKEKNLVRLKFKIQILLALVI